MAWDTSCRDWQERLLSGRAPIPDLPIFQPEGAKALRVFKRLRLPDVIGTPTMGEAAGDWFFKIVEAFFGSYDLAANRRMVQELFLLVPKKNMKSTGAAGIMVTAAILNKRPEAEFTLVAPTKEVTGIAFNQAKGIIKRDPALDAKFQVRDHIKTIQHRTTGAVLQIKAADTDVITGSKATGTLIDETHVFAKRSNAADIFVELRGALAARPDGFLIQITTQSKDPPAGVFKQELNTARDVRDGVISLPLLPVLYELPPEIARDNGWRDKTFWPLVNPNMGRSVDEQFLENQLLKAERDGRGAMALLASQHFNVEVGMSLHGDRWAGADFWERQVDPNLTKEELLRRCEVVVVGIDGGGLDDLFGLCLLGRCRETKHWLCWSHAWCHDGVLKRRQSIETVLRDFERAGELTIVGDELDDVSEIIGVIEEVQDAGLLACVAVDPAGLGEFVDALANINITQEAKTLIGVPQGYAMMNAIKSAERKLASGTLWHSKDGLTAWAVGNLKIEPLATAIRATKQNAGDAKIDPVMALFDAATIMSRNPSAQQSVFDALSDENPEQTPDDEAQERAGDAEILRDYAHPEWQAARERYESRLSPADEDFP